MCVCVCVCRSLLEKFVTEFVERRYGQRVWIHVALEARERRLGTSAPYAHNGLWRLRVEPLAESLCDLCRMHQSADRESAIVSRLFARAMVLNRIDARAVRAQSVYDELERVLCSRALLLV